MIRILRHLRRQLEASILTRSGSFLIPCAILALSLASAERTFTGMQSFTGNTTAVSALITFGVQTLLLVLAWKLGDAYAAHGFRKALAAERSTTIPFQQRVWDWLMRNFFMENRLLMFSFGICAAICVFFSFDAFFRYIVPADQKTIVSKNEARGVVQAMGVNFAESLRRAEVEAAAKLVEGDDWSKYKSEIVKISSIATDPDVADERKKRQAKQNADQIENTRTAMAELNRATAVRDTLATKKEQLTKDRNELQTQKEQIETDKKANAHDVKAKREEVEQAQNVLDREERIGTAERNAGRGPVWRQYKQTFDELDRQLQGLIADGPKLLAEGTRISARLSEADSGLQQTDLALADAAAAIEALKKGIPGATNTNLTPASGDAEVAATDLARLADQLGSNPTADGWKQVTGQCTTVLNLLRRSSDTRAKASGRDCEPPIELSKLAAKLGDIEARRVNFKSSCSSSNPRASFKDLIDHGEQCLEIAQLDDAESLKLGKRLKEVSEEQDESAHDFTRTIFAFRRGDTLAHLSVLLALGLDGLILLCGLWGARMRVGHLTRRDDETASEIDNHAVSAMMMELRPRAARPPGGWAEPADVYKARVFLRHLQPRENSDQLEFPSSISLANLTELEQQVVKAILAIGPYTLPANESSKSATWFVSKRMIRFLTRMVADHDKLQHLYGRAENSAEEQANAPAAAPQQQSAPFSLTSYWANVAAAANQRPARPEEEYLNAGVNAYMSDEDEVPRQERDRSAAA